MFKSISLITSTVKADGKIDILYHINDTYFNIDIVVDRRSSLSIQPTAYEIVALILGYERNGSSVAKNIAQFYWNKNLVNSANYLNRYIAAYFVSDCNWMSIVFPELKYQEKYFSCISNHLEKLKFIGTKN